MRSLHTLPSCGLILAFGLSVLACSGGGEHVVEPVSAPAQLEPVIDVEGAPRQHCADATRFSCAVAGGKTLALCEEEGSLVYRFGALGSIEKEYPGEGVTPSWTYEEPTTVSASGNGVSFAGESHSFQVVEMAGAGGANAEANNFAGVVVSKGEAVVSTISCVGPVESDWARIAELAAQ